MLSKPAAFGWRIGDFGNGLSDLIGDFDDVGMASADVNVVGEPGDLFDYVFEEGVFLVEIDDRLDVGFSPSQQRSSNNVSRSGSGTTAQRSCFPLNENVTAPKSPVSFASALSF